MERLAPLDVSFLALEDDVNHMHVGSIAVFAGPAPAQAELLALIESRLDQAPRHRQRVRSVPFGTARPVWEDDVHFKLDHHVRRTALPAPGGIDELRAMVARVMAQPLDRARPLWELWIVDGVDGEHWAIVGKFHHALLGGMPGAELFTAILDATQPPSGAAAGIGEGAATTWQAREPATDLALLRNALGDLVRPDDPIATIRGAVTLPLRIVGQTLETARALTSLAGLVRPRPGGHITGAIGPHRRYGWAQTPLDDVVRIKDVLGGTVNDVILTAVTTGFRDLLLARGQEVAGRTVKAMVPVSVRNEGERSWRNRVSAVIAELPVGAEDPATALASISAQLADAHPSSQSVAADTLTSLAGFAPPMLLGLGMRAAARLVRGTEPFAVDTVVTNSPGPQMPRYLLGRELLHTFPYAPLATPMRIVVAVFSYAGELTFGVTADWDSVPDIEDFIAGIEGGLMELQFLADQVETA